MARLGKVLLGLKLITPGQLKQGVAAQIIYGGRLGTNLVELGFLEIDALANALARRRGMPAALRGHFDLVDSEIQERLPARLADRWKVVPLGRLAHDPSRIAVAAMDPLPADGRATIAGCLDVDPEQLVLALTPELRILYHLERTYGIERAIRFLRIRNPEPAYLPEAPVDDDVSDVEIQIIHDPETAVTEPLRRPVRPPAGAAEDDSDDGGDPYDDAIEDDDRERVRGRPGSDPSIRPPPALDYLVAPPVADEIGREQRTFVPSLGDAAVTLARITVRKVVSEPFLRLVDLRERPRPTVASALLRAVRRAESREHVA